MCNESSSHLRQAHTRDASAPSRIVPNDPASRSPARWFAADQMRASRWLRTVRLRTFRSRKVGMSLPFSYCYELRLQRHLENVASIHTAADLHVRPRFSNRADLKNRGRRGRSKKYTTAVFATNMIRWTAESRRARDSAAVGFEVNGKILICADSNRADDNWRDRRKRYSRIVYLRAARDGLFKALVLALPISDSRPRFFVSARRG